MSTFRVKTLTTAVITTLIILIISAVILTKRYERIQANKYLNQITSTLVTQTTQLTFNLTQLNKQLPNTEATELLSLMYQQINAAHEIKNMYLAKADGTFFSLLTGNPFHNYIVTYDNTDHGSKPISLIDQSFWRVYFLQNKKQSHQLWLNPFDTASLILTVPIKKAGTNTSQLVCIVLPMESWLKSPNDKFNIQVSKNAQSIWRSNPKVDKYPITMKETPESFNSFLISGSYEPSYYNLLRR